MPSKAKNMTQDQHGYVQSVTTTSTEIEVLQIVEIDFPSKRSEGYQPLTQTDHRHVVIGRDLEPDEELYASASLRGFRLNFVGEDHHLRTIIADATASAEIIDGQAVELNTTYTSLLRDDHDDRKWATRGTVVVTLYASRPALRS